MTRSTNDKISLNERGPKFYASQEEQEMSRLKEALNRTGEEKFYFLMQLMKLQETFKKGIIEHKKI